MSVWLSLAQEFCEDRNLLDEYDGPIRNRPLRFREYQQLAQTYFDRLGVPLNPVPDPLAPVPVPAPAPVPASTAPNVSNEEFEAMKTELDEVKTELAATKTRLEDLQML